MAPQGQTSVMLEIPCNPGDATWQAPLADLRGRVTADLASLGVDTAQLGDETFEARSEYAYPLMDLGYQARRNEAIKACTACWPSPAVIRSTTRARSVRCF